LTSPRSPEPAAGIFVTGTDTGVGKTTVAVALTRLCSRRGGAPIPYKPVETGCAPEPEDARRLWEAARRPIPLSDVCPFPFPLPVAPAAAAAAAGIRLDVAQLVRHAFEIAAHGTFLIAEGAGGLLVPYAGRDTNADIAARLHLPVLVVARTALGTINHVALTLSELSQRRLPIAGVVLVRSGLEIEPQESTNAQLIEQVSGIAPLGTLPRLSDADARDPDRLADALELALPNGALARLLGETTSDASPAGAQPRLR
jgi:dethiobiotin synthetase